MGNGVSNCTARCPSRTAFLKVTKNNNIHMRTAIVDAPKIPTMIFSELQNKTVDELRLYLIQLQSAATKQAGVYSSASLLTVGRLAVVLMPPMCCYALVAVF